jgi:hypothetical protein
MVCRGRLVGNAEVSVWATPRLIVDQVPFARCDPANHLTYSPMAMGTLEPSVCRGDRQDNGTLAIHPTQSGETFRLSPRRILFLD